jgi:hypothetical protein
LEETNIRASSSRGWKLTQFKPIQQDHRDDMRPNRVERRTGGFEEEYQTRTPSNTPGLQWEKHEALQLGYHTGNLKGNAGRKAVSESSWSV